MGLEYRMLRNSKSDAKGHISIGSIFVKKKKNADETNAQRLQQVSVCWRSTGSDCCGSEFLSGYVQRFWSLIVCFFIIWPLLAMKLILNRLYTNKVNIV